MPMVLRVLKAALPIVLAILPAAALGQDLSGKRIAAHGGVDITSSDAFFSFYPRDLCALSELASSTFRYECNFDGQREVFTFEIADDPDILVLEDVDMSGENLTYEQSVGLLREIFQLSP